MEYPELGPGLRPDMLNNRNTWAFSNVSLNREIHSSWGHPGNVGNEDPDWQVKLARQAWRAGKATEYKHTLEVNKARWRFED